MCATAPRSRRPARPPAQSTSRAARWSSRPISRRPTAEKSLAFDKPVILHCASGGRAALAGKLLKDMGYEKVYNLGGFKDWVEAGGKVDK